MGDLLVLIALGHLSRAEMIKCCFKTKNITKTSGDQLFHLILRESYNKQDVKIKEVLSPTLYYQPFFFFFLEN